MILKNKDNGDGVDKMDLQYVSRIRSFQHSWSNGEALVICHKYLPILV